MAQDFPKRQILRDRLEFIEFRLLWEGRINRRDLTDRFRISPSQASTDLTRYQELVKTGVQYDTATKAYVTTSGYAPALLKDSVDSYFTQLRLTRTDFPTALNWIRRAPDFDVLPRARPPISTELLRQIVSALREKGKERQLEIKYQSASDDAARWRLIAPHSLVDDRFRWHIRAWCFEHRDFRDFVLGRILEVRAMVPTTITGDLDDEWNERIELQLAPHPHAPERERRALELDYNMSGGKASLHIRASLFRYLEWQLRLDLPQLDVPSSSMQVVLLNRNQVVAACRAKRESATQKGRAAMQQANQASSETFVRPPSS